MKVTAVKVFTQNLADDLAPGSVLLLVAFVVNSLYLPREVRACSSRADT